MSKLIRLTVEALHAFKLYKNPFTYIKERFKKFPNQTITLKLRNGLQLKLNTNTNEIGTLNEIWHLGIYDRFLPLLKSDSTVIDVGANIGTFSIKAGNIVKNGRVLCFEPFPKNFEILKENILLNRMEKVIKAFNSAVGGKKGDAELFFHERDSGGGSFYQHGNIDKLKSIQVNCITLEDIFNENNLKSCDFLKMDCEGAEENILLNTPKNILQKIKTLTIEWHDDLSKIGFEKFKEFLKDNGYQVDFDKNTGTLYAQRKQS